MIIEPRDFDNGAIFYIKASNDTEFVLLTACVRLNSISLSPTSSTLPSKQRMTTTDPQHALVTASIDIHWAIKAVAEFAEKYPVERLSYDQAYALSHAADLIFDRMWERDHPKGHKDTCLTCGAEVPPGPDFCGTECEEKWNQRKRFTERQ